MMKTNANWMVPVPAGGAFQVIVILVKSTLEDGWS